nr:TetR/AcrR family transcriptional regulator [Streptomyces sp. SID5914]
MIIEAAKQIFLTRGLAGARTKDIATAAGVNEGLIYRHFDSKEEIFAAAVVEPLQSLVTTGVARTGDLSAVEGDLQYDNTRRFIADLLELMVDVVPLLGIVLFSERDTGTEFYRTQIAPALDTVTESVEQRMPDWNHRDFQPRVVTTSVLGICLGIGLDASFRGTEVDIDQTATEIADLIFEGVRPRTDDGARQVPSP